MLEDQDMDDVGRRCIDAFPEKDTLVGRNWGAKSGGV
jgi:hypothetical protein